MIGKWLNRLVLLVLIFPLIAAAEEVYRMRDESGQIIFTDTPPAGKAGIEAVELPPPPSKASVQDTEARHEAIRRHLEESRRERQAEVEERENRLSVLRQKLQEAEANLKAAKELKVEDRQSLAGGGRRIRPEYFERVKEAEAAVKAAREKLKQARGR